MIAGANFSFNLGSLKSLLAYMIPAGVHNVLINIGDVRVIAMKKMYFWGINCILLYQIAKQTAISLLIKENRLTHRNQHKMRNSSRSNLFYTPRAKYQD